MSKRNTRPKDTYDTISSRPRSRRVRYGAIAILVAMVASTVASLVGGIANTVDQAPPAEPVIQVQPGF